MMSPSDIQERQLKSGLGYDKKDVELFLQEISTDYEILMKDHDELNNKLKDANESLAYYKSIEKTLQKALVLAEKTAQDTKATAYKEAEVIEKEAKTKAKQILSEALKQIQIYEHKIINLAHQYDLFKIQFESLINTHQELLNSKSLSVNTEEFTWIERGNNHQNNSSKENQDDLAAVTKEPEYKESKDKEPEEPLNNSEDINQLQFDFLKDAGIQSYQTEDGFEFFTMKDE